MIFPVLGGISGWYKTISSTISPIKSLI